MMFSISALFIAAFIMVLLFIINVVTSIWVYRDAKSLGRSDEYALLALIATFFFPVLGLIVYLIIRKN